MQADNEMHLCVIKISWKLVASTFFRVRFDVKEKNVQNALTLVQQ